MGDQRVPAFHERFHHHLPIGGHDLADPDRRGALFVLPAAEMFGQRRQILGQRRPAGVLAQEDIAAPAPDLGLGQRHFLVFQMREVPPAGDFVERTGLLPRKAVKGTGEDIGIAVLGAQLAAAMQADVVKGAHRTIGLPRNKIGAPGVFIDDVIAVVGQILLTRRELPDIGPHLLGLERREFGAGIARCRQRFGAAILITFVQQEVRHRPRITLHQVGPADAGRTRCAGWQLGIDVGHGRCSCLVARTMTRQPSRVTLDKAQVPRRAACGMVTRQAETRR